MILFLSELWVRFLPPGGRDYLFFLQNPYLFPLFPNPSPSPLLLTRGGGDSPRNPKILYVSQHPPVRQIPPLNNRHTFPCLELNSRLVCLPFGAICVRVRARVRLCASLRVSECVLWGGGFVCMTSPLTFSIYRLRDRCIPTARPFVPLRANSGGGDRGAQPVGPKTQTTHRICEKE